MTVTDNFLSALTIEKTTSGETISDKPKAAETAPAAVKNAAGVSASARGADFLLAQRAAAGDMEAFEEIYWKYHRRVFAVCYQMCKNPAETEDLTQQVFIQLFKKIGSFRGDSAFSTWLHRLTVNLVLMDFRKKRSFREETTEDGTLPEPSHQNGNKNKGNQAIERILLEEAIEKLPKGYRQMLILHDICGFEHSEIAAILGCASGTSKSQLFKARRRLREFLSPDADNGTLQSAV